jgi:hypothetical protein
VSLPRVGNQFMLLMFCRLAKLCNVGVSGKEFTVEVHHGGFFLDLDIQSHMWMKRFRGLIIVK